MAERLSVGLGEEWSGAIVHQKPGAECAKWEWDKTVKVWAGDCVTSAAELRAPFVEKCGIALFIWDVGAVARDELVAVGKSALSTTKENARRTGVRNGLKRGGDGKLGELHYGRARKVLRRIGMQSPSVEGEAALKKVRT